MKEDVTIPCKLPLSSTDQLTWNWTSSFLNTSKVSLLSNGDLYIRYDSDKYQNNIDSFSREYFLMISCGYLHFLTISGSLIHLILITYLYLPTQFSQILGFLGPHTMLHTA